MWYIFYSCVGIRFADIVQRELNCLNILKFSSLCIVLEEEKEDDRKGKNWGNLLKGIDKKTSRREGK